MKKLSLFILSIIFSLFFSGCASNKFDFSQVKNIGILGVNGSPNLVPVNPDGEPEEDEGRSSLTNTVSKLLDSKNPELLTAEERVNYSEEYLRKALEDTAGCSLVEKEAVTDSSVYKKHSVATFAFLNSVYSAEGYRKDLLQISNKTARMLQKESGTDCLIGISLEFQKKYDMEFSARTNSNITASILMNTYLYDKDGKQHWYSLRVEAPEKLPVRAGGYDQEALIAMYPELIETAINNFIVKYLGE